MSTKKTSKTGAIEEIIGFLIVVWVMLVPLGLVLQLFASGLVIIPNKCEYRPWAYSSQYDCHGTRLPFSSLSTFSDKNNCITLIMGGIYVLQYPAALTEDIAAGIAEVVWDVLSFGADITGKILNTQLYCFPTKEVPCK